MSYRTILSVINQHTSSTVIAHYAVALAKECRARLVLYAAHPEGTSESTLKHTDRHLEHLVAFADELEVSVKQMRVVG